MIKNLSDMKISARLVADEMQRRGWELEIIAPGYSYVRARHPEAAASLLVRSVIDDSTSYVNGALCDNKYVFAQLMKSADIPIPRTEWFSPAEEDSHQQARELLESCGSVVVKPIDTNHGDGITLGVTNFEVMWSAAQYALSLSKEKGCLVQEEVKGADYRFMIVGGKLVAASGRRPAHVVGNGEDSVQRLIDTVNASPLRGEGHSSPLTRISQESVEKYLTPAQLDAVPEKGEEIQVVGVANLSQGGEAMDITDEIHPELKQLAEAVASSLGVRTLGVDIMTSDYTKSPAETGAKVIEANFSPGIRMHHFPSHGRERDIAKLIVDDIEQRHLHLN